ncbi:hypothetical protein [uncultured Corynebacterium sp.]|uniref:hypothetical protein n=1 Tax=uncultured Corynebacterium sp. TaxID=159447 RepID=UPI0025CBE366|nr:hypothetical protein [uncultured Corynebacterium sp.]
MSLTVNLYDAGSNGAARAFAEEKEASGIAGAIRAEDGNLAYRYLQPLDDPETVLREKYDLHMRVERYVSAEENPPNGR